MKSILTTISLILCTGIQTIIACEVCKNNQPEILQNITHGTGPQGNWDYIIIWTSVIIVTFTLIMSLVYLIKPNEQQAGHIKNIVLNKK